MPVIITPKDSILTSIKKLTSGITETDTSFDLDFILNINTALAILSHIGVGESTGFAIEDKNDTWQDFMGEDTRLNFVVSYVHLKVKLLFDPPQSSSAVDAIERTLKELEWRILDVTETLEREENQNE